MKSEATTRRTVQTTVKTGHGLVKLEFYYLDIIQIIRNILKHTEVTPCRISCKLHGLPPVKLSRHALQNNNSHE